MAVNEQNMRNHCLKTYERHLIFAGQCGSIVHNLYRPDSDDDYYIVLAPNFHDLYTHEPFHEERLTPTADYFYFNGVEFRDHLEKLNPNFLDTLYSSNIVYIHPELRWMVKIREKIARSNLPALYRSYQELAFDLEHKFSRPSQDADVINKCLMHIARIDHVLTEYHRLDFESYGAAIFCDDQTRTNLLRLRHGLSPVDVKGLLQNEKEYLFYHHFKNISDMENLYLQKEVSSLSTYFFLLERSMERICFPYLQK